MSRLAVAVCATFSTFGKKKYEMCRPRRYAVSVMPLARRDALLSLGPLVFFFAGAVAFTRLPSGASDSFLYQPTIWAGGSFDTTAK